MLKRMICFFGFLFSHILVVNCKVSLPTGLKVNEVGVDYFILSWDWSTEDVKHMLIVQDELAPPPSSPAQGKYVTNNTRQFVNSMSTGNPIEGSTLYDVYLFAINSTVDADFSYAVYDNLLTVPGPPYMPMVDSSADDPSAPLLVSWYKKIVDDGMVDGYIDYRICDDIHSIIVGPIPGVQRFEYIITGLTPGQCYNFTTRARNSAGIGPSSKKLFYVTDIPTPQNVMATLPTSGDKSTSINVTWEMPDTDFVISDYVVRRHSNASIQFYHLRDVSVSSPRQFNWHVITDVDTGTYQCFDIQARSSFPDSAKYGVISNQSNICQTVPGPPAIPTIPTSSQVPSYVQVDWRSTSGEEDTLYFVVEWELTSGGDFSESEAVNYYDSTINYSYFISGMSEWQNYNVTVRVVNGAGSGQPSQPVIRVSDPPIPNNAAILTPSGLDASTIINATWEMPGYQFSLSSYEIYVDSYLQNSFIIKYFADQNSPNWFIVPGLPPCSNVIIQIRTVNSYSNRITYSPYTIPSSVYQTAPPPPLNASLHADYNYPTSKINVTWKPYELDIQIHIKNYIITWWTNIDSPVVQSATIEAPNIDINSLFEYVIAELIPGETYNVTITSKTKDRVGPPTLPLMYMTEPPTPTDIELFSFKTDEEVTNVNIVWEMPETSFCISAYMIYIDTLSASYSIIQYANETNPYTYTVYNITSGMSVDVTMQTVSNTMGESKKSKMSNTSTIQTEPPTPFNITLSNLNVTNKLTQLTTTWRMRDILPWFSYIIVLIPSNGWSIQSKINASSTNTYVADNLIPGQIYTATIQTVSKPSRYETFSGIAYSNKQQTETDFIRNLVVILNEGSPENKIDLSWNTVHGIGDIIKIQYIGNPANTTNTKLANFTDTRVSLHVVSGNNYTIIMTVRSHNISSREVTSDITTKPVMPEYNITTTMTQLLIAWKQLDGYAENIIIQSQPIDVFPMATLSGLATSFMISNLDPYTDYTLLIYSIVTNVDGNIETSTAAPTMWTTYVESYCLMTTSIYQGRYSSFIVTFPQTHAGYSCTTEETCRIESGKGSPLGTRACSLSGEWREPIWLSSCEVTLESLSLVNISNDEEREQVASDLVVLTSNSHILHSHDVNLSADILENIITTTNTTLNHNVSSLVVGGVGNLLNVKEVVLDESRVGSRLLVTLNEVAMKVNLSKGKDFESLTNTLGVSVVEVLQEGGLNGISYNERFNPSTEVLGFSVGQFYTNIGNISSSNSSIYVPFEAIHKAIERRISFFAFLDDKIFQTAESSTELDDDWLVSRAIVNSRVILSASAVDALTPVRNLKEKVIVTLQLNQEISKPKSDNIIICGFWIEDATYWSSDGCVTSFLSSNRVKCECDHLTNFASLFAYRDSSKIRGNKTLDILTIVGCSISLLAICVTIISSLHVWSKCTSPTQARTMFVMMNLSIALLLLNVFLLISQFHDVTSNDSSCMAIAIILHFSLFSSLCWLTNESIHVYLAVTKAIYFRTGISRRKLYVYSVTLGWGVPGVFVTLLSTISSSWYQNDKDVCWIDSEWMVCLVIIPASLILSFNLITYIFVVIGFIYHKKPGENRIKRRRASESITFSLSLFVMFGITWVFGFLVFDSSDVSLAFAYIFTIFNSLQGLFLFILFVIRNKNIREKITNQMKAFRFIQPANKDLYKNKETTVKLSKQIPKATGAISQQRNNKVKSFP